MKTRAQWEKILSEVPEEHADLLLSAAAKVRQSLYGGGPARKPLPCPKGCGGMFSAREMRVHKPRCGAHLVQCRHGCGFSGNPMGASQHEAVCANNPKSKKAIQ